VKCISQQKGNIRFVLTKQLTKKVNYYVYDYLLCIGLVCVVWKSWYYCCCFCWRSLISLWSKKNCGEIIMAIYRTQKSNRPVASV